MCPICILSNHGDQKRVSDPLKLVLQMAVGHHVDAGNQTPVLCKSSQCSKSPSHFSDLLVRQPKRGNKPWTWAILSHAELLDGIKTVINLQMNGDLPPTPATMAPPPCAVPLHKL
jgi:hypothetical protein